MLLTVGTSHFSPAVGGGGGGGGDLDCAWRVESGVANERDSQVCHSLSIVLVWNIHTCIPPHSLRSSRYC